MISREKPAMLKKIVRALQEYKTKKAEIAFEAYMAGRGPRLPSAAHHEPDDMRLARLTDQANYGRTI
jgi:hypothetical protein